MDKKDRAAIHVASANAGQDVAITYDPKYDSYTLDLRPKGPKHAKVTLNTLVVEKLIEVYNVVNGRNKT